VKTWSRLSLRLRLTLLFVGVLAILLSVMGWVFYQDARDLLVETTAAHLRARAKPIIEHWLYGKPLLTTGKQGTPKHRPLKEIAPFLARDLTSRNTTALILDERGRRLADGKRLPEEPDSAPPVPRYVRQALKGKNEVTYEIRRDSLPFLVVLIPLRTSPGSRNIVGVVQLTSSLASVEKTLARHGLMLAGMAFLALLAGSILGLLVVSSSLDELKTMVSTCRAIADGNLGRRVALPERKDEIGQLAHAFDGMVDRLAETMGAQRRFIANAAHELRTPLTALQGSLEVLLRGVQDDPAAAARLIQGMYREVTKLSRLCERLLDLSRMEGVGSLHKQPIALRDFFEGLLPQLERLAPDREWVLDAGPHVTLQFDPEMFRQVFFNLAQNAAQHTAPGGRIVVGWRLATRPEGVTLYVSDDGEGIDPEDLPHIFEPFYRGRTRGTDETGSGTGLGLSIVKAIVTAHGGKVEVQSVPGKGTKIILSVPFG